MTEEDWTKAMGELEIFLLRVSSRMSKGYESHMSWLSRHTAKFVRFFRELRSRDPSRLYDLWALSHERRPNEDAVRRFYADWTAYLERDSLAA